MIIKTKNIGPQFFFQSLFAFISIGVLIFLFAFSGSRKESIFKTIKLTERVSVLASNLNETTEEALSKQKSSPDFVAIVSNELINKENTLINNIVDSLNQLRETNYLKSYFRKNFILDTVVTQLKYYNQSFEILILLLKEKGNTYDGNTGEAFKLSRLLLNDLNAAPDTGKNAGEFSELVSLYFTSQRISYLENLINFCQNVTASYYEYENFDPYTIEEKALSMVKVLENIKAIDKKLYGDLYNPGIIKSLESNSQRLNNLVQDFNLQIDEQSRKYVIWWNFVIVGVSILLFGFLVLSILGLSKILRKSSKNLINVSAKLKEGDILSPIEKDENFEFRTITSNLLDLKQLLVTRNKFVTDLLEDKLDQDLEIFGKSDEFGQELNKLKAKLLKAKQEQEKRNEENEIRRYINEGLAKFADIMRVNSNNTEALGDNLIKGLVKYLDGIQGTLFLTNEENPDELQMISAFAYDRKKYMRKSVKLGEGLIGTCANELKTIYLKKVPPDYALIRSGLGDSPPDKLLIIPVKHDEDLVGVLELASLKNFNEHGIDLAEQIASNLASTIITVRNNARTAQLLEKSQQQAAEMAEQEEEMRQNMEELKATQEESTRREEEMQGIIDAIGTTFYVVEYNSDGVIEHLNDKLVRFTEQSYESIVGRKHSDIFSGDSKINSKLINEIIKSKQPEKIVEELNWGSKKYIYSHFISPILSRHSEVIKLINLMTIEEKK